jgi:hypothetical protein
MNFFREKDWQGEIGKGELPRPRIDTAMKPALKRQQNKEKRQKKEENSIFCF